MVGVAHVAAGDHGLTVACQVCGDQFAARNEYARFCGIACTRKARDWPTFACTWCGFKFRALEERRLCSSACSHQERRAWRYLDVKGIDTNVALGVTVDRILDAFGLT